MVSSVQNYHKLKKIYKLFILNINGASSKYRKIKNRNNKNIEWKIKTLFFWKKIEVFFSKIEYRIQISFEKYRNNKNIKKKA